MRNVRRASLVALIAGFTLCGVATAQPAEKAPSGKSLVVPEAHAKKGKVYYSISGKGRQIHFHSDAPVEQIKGQSNQVIGYCIAGKDQPAALQAGEWHVPVTSLKTGRGRMDEHIQGKPWLDAASHPDIIFTLKRVSDLKADEGRKSWTGTLEGTMTLHGVTKPVTIKDATIAMVGEDDAGAKGIKGDLMAIRAKYPVVLSEFGVKNSNIPDKVADQLQLETTLYMSTVKPEEQPAKTPTDGGDGKPASGGG